MKSIAFPKSAILVLKIIRNSENEERAVRKQVLIYSSNTRENKDNEFIKLLLRNEILLLK